MIAIACARVEVLVQTLSLPVSSSPFLDRLLLSLLQRLLSSVPAVRQGCATMWVRVWVWEWTRVWMLV
eukprot:6073394-Alexandrium_andersonii.AAC.1